MKIKIEFEIEIDDLEHTEDELEEYLRFNFNDNGSMKSSNPLNKNKKRIEPIFGTFEFEEID